MEEEKNNEQKQDQQIESKLKDMGREVAKNAKKKVKVIAMNVISSVSLLAFKISLIVVVVILVGGIIEWIQEKFSSEEAAKIMYETMQIEDVAELVQIKKDDDGNGYHLEFIDGIDEKIKSAVKEIGKKCEALNDVELVKKFIRAEVATKFPNLGGKGETIRVNNSSDNLNGFLFIGDSITEGLELSGYINGEGCIFKGVSSSHPSQWLNNVAVNGKTTYSSLPQNSDSIKGICIMLGTNGANDNASVNSEYNSMEKLLKKLHEKYPNKIIYVQKILPMESHQDSVNEYNKKLEDFCNSNDYTIFIDATNNVELSNDGIHPNNNGYKKLSDNIYEQVSNNSKKNEEENSDEKNDNEIEENKEFQGSINIKRIMPNKNIGEIKDNAGKKEINLKYVDYNTFKNYVDNNNEEALNVFTLSGDMKELITATWSYDGSVHIIQNSNMAYRDVTAQFTMPFEYPMIFQITGKEKDFSKKLADLAIGSSIDISVIDNIQTTKTVTTTTIYSDESGENSVISGPTSVTSITENVSTNVQPTNINSWWTKRNVKVEFYDNVSQDSPNGVTNTEFIQGDDGQVIHKTTVEETQNTVYSNDVQITSNEFESNHEGFVRIYKNSKSAKGNIQKSWLFDFLKNNEKTSNMVELTKYLFYMATEKNYGVTKFEKLDLLSSLDNVIDFTNRREWDRR